MDGYRQGKYIRKSPFGNVEIECNYNHDLLHGKYKEWYYYVGKRTGKTLIADLDYVNGKLNGKCVYRYRNGNIKLEVEYKDGIRNGVFNTYTKNGCRLVESTYKMVSVKAPLSSV